MRFANPIFLLLGLVVLIIILWRNRIALYSTLHFSNISSLKQLGDNKSKIFARLGLILRYFILILMIIALARPQGVSYQKETTTEGIDIMLVLDTSGSMKEIGRAHV